jgi:hypothetical protein
MTDKGVAPVILHTKSIFIKKI